VDFATPNQAAIRFAASALASKKRVKSTGFGLYGGSVGERVTVQPTSISLTGRANLPIV